MCQRHQDWNSRFVNVTIALSDLNSHPNIDRSSSTKFSNVNENHYQQKDELSLVYPSSQVESEISHLMFGDIRLSDFANNQENSHVFAYYDDLASNKFYFSQSFTDTDDSCQSQNYVLTDLYVDSPEKINDILKNGIQNGLNSRNEIISVGSLFQNNFDEQRPLVNIPLYEMNVTWNDSLSTSYNNSQETGTPVSQITNDENVGQVNRPLTPLEVSFPTPDSVEVQNIYVTTNATPPKNIPPETKKIPVNPPPVQYLYDKKTEAIEKPYLPVKASPTKSPLISKAPSRSKGLLPIELALLARLKISEYNLAILSPFDFNNLCQSLIESDVVLLRDIRRRTKNKIAARECRKRRMLTHKELTEKVAQQEAKCNELVIKINQFKEMKIALIKTLQELPLPPNQNNNCI